MKFFKGRAVAMAPEDEAAAGRLRDVVGRGHAEVYPSPPMIYLDALKSTPRLFWSPHELAQEGEA